MAPSVPASLAALAPEMTAWRRHLHAHPELAFEEVKTADFIAARLESFGLTPHRGLAQTGVVAVIDGERPGTGGRRVGLRADMDALSLEERSGLPHASCHKGLMHGCGHDGHMAMLLGAACDLARSRAFAGQVVVIFQPAEEMRGGAQAMIEAGLFERFPVDAVFGLHNWPSLPAGQFGIIPGPVMASADMVDIRLTGQGTHAAMPHLGDDVVLAAAHLVTALQSLISRRLDPLDSAVLSITRLEAGEAGNILPAQAWLQGTLRTLQPATRAALPAQIRSLAEGLAAGFNIQAAVTLHDGYPPTLNHPAETALCQRVAASLVGADKVRTDLKPSMGAEDFAYMLERKPGCYVWLGSGVAEPSADGAKPSLGRPLHNPYYDFNDAVLPLGAAYWSALARAFLDGARIELDGA